jgi:hypothetical protein
MAWPYTAVSSSPNVDSDFVTLTGVFANVPNMSAAVFWPVSGYIFNPTAAAITFSLKDGNGKQMCPDVLIAAGGDFDLPESWFAMPSAGIWQWKGVGLVGRVWGYQ